MKKRLCLFCFFALALCLVGFGSANSTDREIKNFKLKNIDNHYVSLTNYKNAKGFVVVFTCNKCPMAKFYSERLNALNTKYKTKGVYLLAINAMDTLAYAEESFKKMQKKATQEKLNFPYLQDKLQVVAKQFKATHTPQAFILWKNSSGKLLIKYEGSIDDNAGDASKAKPLVTNALDELLTNKKVTHPKTESFGCKIYYRGETNSMKNT